MKIGKDAADARSRSDIMVREVRYTSPMGIGRYFGVVRARRAPLHEQGGA